MEDGDAVVEEFVVGILQGVELMEGGEVFKLEDFDAGEVFGIAFGGQTEAAAIDGGKITDEIVLVYDGAEFVIVVIDFLSDGFQLLGFGHVDTAANKTSVRLEMKIIACVVNLFARFVETRAEIGFVGRFVFAETHIAEDAEDAIAGLCEEGVAPGLQSLSMGPLDRSLPHAADESNSAWGTA